MTDKEQIRAEIERRIEINKTKAGFPAGVYCAIRIEAYEQLLDFLDTLEEPVSDCHDLEEATEGEWIWATTPPEKPGKYKVQLRYDTYSAIWNGVKWIDDASGFPIMGVFKWKPIKEEQQ